jgi:hypothetical protein
MACACTDNKLCDRASRLEFEAELAHKALVNSGEFWKYPLEFYLLRLKDLREHRGNNEPTI